MDTAMISDSIDLIEEIENNPDYLCRISKKDSEFIEKAWNGFLQCYGSCPNSNSSNLPLEKNQLSKLITSGNIDDEAVWHLIDLINNSKHNDEATIDFLTTPKKDLLLPVKIVDEDDSSAVRDSLVETEDNPTEAADLDDALSDSKLSDNSDGEAIDSDDELYDKESDGPESEKDVDFFNEKAMMKFLKDSESNKGKTEEDDIDYFEDVPSEDDSEAESIKYKDFFKTGESEGNPDADEDEEDIDGSLSGDSQLEEDNLEEKVKSSFELKQERLKNRIDKLEEEALKEKPWPLKGEVDAYQRPVNSLLEEVVEIDLSQRPAPIITKEVTMKLEDIILKRIKDKAYDDVEKKIKPIDNVHEFKKAIVLDQEKSKLSLAEVYEKEYLKQKDEQNTEKDFEEKLTPEKEQIKKDMEILFKKLDTLSNFHFIPRPPAPEIKIVTNQPSIMMEEVAPVSTAQGSHLLAPEEISGTSKRQLIGQDEKTSTDKKRERRKKKKLQAMRAKRSFKNPLASTNIVKKKDGKTLDSSSFGSIKSSKSFFSKLQDDYDSGAIHKKRKPNSIDNLKAKKLKL